MSNENPPNKASVAVRQKVVASQIKGGFLDLLKDAQDLFLYSENSRRVPVFFDSDSTAVMVNLIGWRHGTPMLTGLRGWFRKNNAQVGSVVEIQKISDMHYRLQFVANGTSGTSTQEPTRTPFEPMTIDASNAKTDSNSASAVFETESSAKEALVWSHHRLPFEPAGEIVELRSGIRRAIASLVASDSRQLYACYYSTIRDSVDIENVLFYNVGSSFFSHLDLHAVVFERSFSKPRPSSKGKNYSHLHHYSIEEAKFRQWVPKEILAEFSTVISKPAHSLSDLRVAEIWYAMKKGEMRMTKEHSQYRSGDPLCLELDIAIPSFGNPRLVSMMKVLIDGVVSAFHSEKFPDRYVMQYMAQLLNVDAETVGKILAREDDSILGSRELVYKRANGIQWNPADDDLVAVRLSMSRVNTGSMKLSGKISLATRQ